MPTPLAQSELAAAYGLIAVALCLLIVLAALGAFLYRDRRTQRQGQGEAMQHIRQQAEAARAHNEREAIAFEQHRQMNELALQKIRLEVQALTTQLKLMESDLRRRTDAEAFHDLMTEKARVEIEALRLQVREQRKRLDDYGQFED